MTNLYGNEGALKHFLQDQTTSTPAKDPTQSLQVTHSLAGDDLSLRSMYFLLLLLTKLHYWICFKKSHYILQYPISQFSSKPHSSYLHVILNFFRVQVTCRNGGFLSTQ